MEGEFVYAVTLEKDPDGETCRIECQALGILWEGKFDRRYKPVKLYKRMLERIIESREMPPQSEERIEAAKECCLVCKIGPNGSMDCALYHRLHGETALPPELKPELE